MSLYYIGKRPKHSFAKPIEYLFKERSSRPAQSATPVSQADDEFRKRMLASIAGLEPRVPVKLQPKPRRPIPTDDTAYNKLLSRFGLTSFY